MKIGVIGSKDFCIGFYVAGIENVYIVNTKEEFNNILKQVLVDESTGILILDESFEIDKEVRRFYLNKSKAIILYLNEIEQIKKELKDALGIEVLK